MAALRWELMEEYSEVTKRKNIHLSDFEKEKEEIIREYPPLDWEYEESVIYKKKFDRIYFKTRHRKSGQKASCERMYYEKVHR